jgi:hypothetical protein
MTFADFNLIGTIPVSKEALNKISRGSAIIFLSSFKTEITNVPHLANLDVDLNMPADQNFNYYNIHDFHSNYNIN